ncbi:MAG: hypothetical protein NTW78_11910 [Campylobacterales bacterium]|nr:hypothetical protein [Campylobacterales bacterium]
MVEKFKLTIKKEVLYYLFTLLALALIMHNDLLNNPLLRLHNMYEKENFFHPFLYSFVIYCAILILRKTIDFIIGIFEKKTH